MIKETITYKVKGMNFKKFLTRLKQDGLEVFSLKRKDFNLFYITISKSQSAYFTNLANKNNYDITIVNKTYSLKLKDKIKKHFALSLSILFILLSITFFSNIVVKVEVYGCERVSKSQVIKVLEDNNIKMHKFKSSYNLSIIESLLKQNIDKVSLASAVIKGNTIIINIDEKIDNDEYIYDYKPLQAPYDCIVKQVVLKSGTLVVEEGQTVKKGEVLVEPYINYKDGTRLSVEAKADVQVYIEISNTIEYLENHMEYVRTGKRVTKEELSIYKLNLGGKKISIPFKKYQMEQYSYYPFKNFIMPLLKTKTIYYELIEKQTYVPFENVKQNIIEQNKKMLYNTISSQEKDNLESFTTINYQDNIYYVTTYLKGLITIS